MGRFDDAMELQSLLMQLEQHPGVKGSVIIGDDVITFSNNQTYGDLDAETIGTHGLKMFNSAESAIRKMKLAQEKP